MGRHQGLRNSLGAYIGHAIHNSDYGATRQLDGYAGYIESLGGIKRRGFSNLDVLISRLEEITFTFKDIMENHSKLATPNIKLVAKDTYKDIFKIILFIRKYHPEIKLKRNDLYISTDLIVSKMRKYNLSTDEINLTLKILSRSMNVLMKDLVVPIQKTLKKDKLCCDSIFSKFNQTKEKIEKIRDNLSLYELIPLDIDYIDDEPDKLLEFINRFWSSVHNYNLLSDSNITRLIINMNYDELLKKEVYKLILNYCSKLETKHSGYKDSYYLFKSFRDTLDRTGVLSSDIIFKKVLDILVENKERYYHLHLMKSSTKYI